MKERFYLAYGSNLSVAQMIHRCPGALYVGTSELKNHRLLFRGSKSGNYLTVERARGYTVPLLVWKVTPSDELMLDVYEGFPAFYEKVDTTVTLYNLADGMSAGEIPAFFYRMTAGRPLGEPTELYFSICQEGYRRFGFDQRILDTAYRESSAHSYLKRRRA